MSRHVGWGEAERTASVFFPASNQRSASCLSLLLVSCFLHSLWVQVSKEQPESLLLVQLHSGSSRFHVSELEFSMPFCPHVSVLCDTLLNFLLFFEKIAIGNLVFCLSNCLYQFYFFSCSKSHLCFFPRWPFTSGYH